MRNEREREGEIKSSVSYKKTYEKKICLYVMQYAKQAEYKSLL